MIERVIFCTEGRALSEHSNKPLITQGGAIVMPLTSSINVRCLHENLRSHGRVLKKIVASACFSCFDAEDTATVFHFHGYSSSYAATGVNV